MQDIHQWQRYGSLYSTAVAVASRLWRQQPTPINTNDQRALNPTRTKYAIPDSGITPEPRLGKVGPDSFYLLQGLVRSAALGVHGEAGTPSKSTTEGHVHNDLWV